MNYFEETCRGMVFDIEALREVDMTAFVQFLSSHNTELTQRYNSVAKDLLLSGKVDGHDPAFASDPDFLDSRAYDWYNSYYTRLCSPSSKGSVMPTILPMAVYLHDCYHLSCSEYLLGCKAKTVPPHWMRQFLKQVNALSFANKMQFYDILDRAANVRCDTLFIFKSRLWELAAENSMSLGELVIYPGIIVESDVALLRDDFVHASFTETGNRLRDMKPFMGKQKILRMLIALSVLYQVSPDRLLLQDYSEYAVTPDGEPYSMSERALMSRILSIDGASRNRAVAFVAAASAIDAMENPYAIAPLEDAAIDSSSAPLNVLAHLNVEGNFGNKIKIESELLESIREQFVELFNSTDEYISSTKLYSFVDGSTRLARNVLFMMEKEGFLERKMINRRNYWRRIPTSPTTK